MSLLTYQSLYDTMKSFPLVTVRLGNGVPVDMFRSTHATVRYMDCLMNMKPLTDVSVPHAPVVNEGMYTLRKVIHPKRAYVSNSWDYYFHLYPNYVLHPQYGHILGYGVWNAPEVANP